MKFYILKDKIPTEIKDIKEWANLQLKANNLIDKTNITQEVTVSTVFLATSTSNEESPKLFETMIFGSIRDHERRLSSTYEEALQTHETIVKELNESINIQKS